MKIKTKDVLFWVAIISLISAFIVIAFMDCNSTPDPPDPELCEISYLVTETEDGKVATVLKNGVEVLRIEATNGIDGEKGEQGISGIDGVNGIDGIDGQDCAFLDTLWMKEIDRQDDQIQYAISTNPLPPEKPEVDTTYVVDVILEGDNWVYILRGDSLRLHWSYDYRDVNGNAIDTAYIHFHVAYEMNGETYSLKPHPNVTEELSLVTRGLPQGDIVPCVAAFIWDPIHSLIGPDRVYSTWAKSTDYGWKARRE